MLDSNSHPSEWLESANGDFAVLQVLLPDASLPRRTVCFTSHLVVEKTLKSVIAAAGGRVVAWHDLLSLHDACAQAGMPLNLDEVELRRLGPWAILGRYDDPANEPSAQFAAEVATFATEVFERVLKEHLPGWRADHSSSTASAEAADGGMPGPFANRVNRSRPTLVPGTDPLVAGLRPRGPRHDQSQGPITPAR
jgi:HEPN domain-containing protein